MLRAVFLLNAFLTIPFGLVGLVAPAAVFAGFGLALDPAGALMARGYAATCLGYGLIFALMRNTTASEAVSALLWGSLVFNLVEVAIQVPAWAGGVAGPAVWGTVLAHAVTAALTLLCLVRRT